MSRTIHRTLGLTLPSLLTLSALACSSASGQAPLQPPTVDATSTEIRDDADEIPCGPRAVLETVCQRCHSLPPANGAPFALVRRSDVLAAKGSVVVRDLMIQQLESGRMPLSPVTLAPDGRAVLLEWLQAGAPAVLPRACTDANADASPSASATSEPGPDAGLDASCDPPADAEDQ